MTKHTPGPWYVAEIRQKYDIIIRARADQSPICSMYYAGYSPFEGRANASLVASSPQMYDGLKMIIAEWDGSDVDRRRALTNAMAVLKIAEGDANRD